MLCPSSSSPVDARYARGIGTAVPTILDPDARLVAAMADGSQGALAQLYMVHQPAMHRIAYALVREHADAEEVVSDTFVQAWRESAAFDGKRGCVGAWLTVIVRSRSLDLIRARDRREAARDRATALARADEPVRCHGGANQPDVTVLIEAQERSAALRRVIRELPPPQREAIELVFLTNVPHARAADQLCLPLGTLKTRVRLGLRRMRELLESVPNCDSPRT
jgi:RNA polymerase sigma-70 factor, ECF subfamily